MCQDSLVASSTARSLGSGQNLRALQELREFDRGLRAHAASLPDGPERELALMHECDQASSIAYMRRTSINVHRIADRPDSSPG